MSEFVDALRHNQFFKVFSWALYAIMAPLSSLFVTHVKIHQAAGRQQRVELLTLLLLAFESARAVLDA